MNNFFRGKTADVVSSFRDLMLSEEQSAATSPPPPFAPSPTKPLPHHSQQQRSHFTSESNVSPRSAEAAWSLSSGSVSRFSDIVKDQQERHCESIKRLGRPFALIQVSWWNSFSFRFYSGVVKNLCVKETLVFCICAKLTWKWNSIWHTSVSNLDIRVFLYENINL